jgi:hypothetical protein
MSHVLLSFWGLRYPKFSGLSHHFHHQTSKWEMIGHIPNFGQIYVCMADITDSQIYHS